MSDDASSSRAAHSSDNTHHDRAQEQAPTASELAGRRKKNRQMFNKKRGELLDDLLRSLDILVYAELSAIYYMEYAASAGSCSFLRFLMRAFVQFVLLTPKPSIFPEPAGERPYIGAIIGSNLLCLLLHAIYAAPSAGEPTRGYLHGGMAIDFIGQKGPTSRLHLLALDLLVVVLQVIHLSAHVTRQRLRDGAVSVTTSHGREYAASAPRQDVDAEERGVRRSGEHDGDIEMQTLNASGSAATVPTATTEESAAEDTSERDSLLASTTAPRTDAHIFDAFNSGQIVLADLDLVKTVKEQFWAYQTAPRETLQSTREMRANIAGQLLRWRFGATVGRPAEQVS